VDFDRAFLPASSAPASLVMLRWFNLRCGVFVLALPLPLIAFGELGITRLGSVGFWLRVLAPLFRERTSSPIGAASGPLLLSVSSSATSSHDSVSSDARACRERPISSVVVSSDFADSGCADSIQPLSMKSTIRIRATLQEWNIEQLELAC